MLLAVILILGLLAGMLLAVLLPQLSWLFVLPLLCAFFLAVVYIPRGRTVRDCPVSVSDATVSVIVPTLNEIEGVQKVLPRIESGWHDQLLVVDGHSADGTLEWCKEHGYETYIQKQSGMWRAFQEIFTSGAVRGDIVVTFSPDGNSLPEVIPKLVDKIREGYDMVIASRYYDGAKSDDDTWLTRIGNRLFTALCRVFSGYRYTDALVIYRAYRADVPKRLGFLRELNWFQKKLADASNLYGWESSMSIRAGKAGLRIAEIGADEPKAYRERRQSTFGHGLILLLQILYEGIFGKKEVNCASS